jgi:hypothetical protein
MNTLSMPSRNSVSLSSRGEEGWGEEASLPVRGTRRRSWASSAESLNRAAHVGTLQTSLPDASLLSPTLSSAGGEGERSSALHSESLRRRRGRQDVT